jgi:hypothetical protein
MYNQSQVFSLAIIIIGLWIKLSPFGIDGYGSVLIQSLWPFIVGYGIGSYLSNDDKY